MANTPGQLVSSGKGARSFPFAPSVMLGHHEALAINRDTILEPSGVRVGADE